MVLTAAKYVHEKIAPGFDEKCMNITDMEILAIRGTEITTPLQPSSPKIKPAHNFQKSCHKGDHP